MVILINLSNLIPNPTCMLIFILMSIFILGPNPTKTRARTLTHMPSIRVKAGETLFMPAYTWHHVSSWQDKVSPQP